METNKDGIGSLLDSHVSKGFFQSLEPLDGGMDMKKMGVIVLVFMVAFAFMVATPTDSSAKQKKFVKFGEDKRAKDWKNKKWTTSKETFRWRMSDTWGGLLFHDISIHFADTVATS